MEVFRLSREKYSKVLSGKGAAIKGARWNSMGHELIYTAANRSLAMAEVAVHFSLATLPLDYFMMTIFIPDSVLIENLDQQTLHEDWNVFPPRKPTQRIGDRFIEKSKSCVLRVPSVVTPGDYNFLLNPQHPDFSGILILDTQKFPFDNRIFKDQKRHSII